MAQCIRRTENIRSALAGAAVFVLLTGSVLWATTPFAHAQVRQISETDNLVRLKTTRIVPSWGPTGIRLGSTFLTPLIEFQEIYDDNVYLRSDNIKSDFITLVKPAVALQSDWDRHAIFLGGQMIAGQYANDLIKAYRDYNLLASARYDFTSATFLNAAVSRSKTHSNRGAIDDPGGDRLLEYTNTSEQLDFQRAPGRVRIEAGVRNEHVELSRFSGQGDEDEDDYTVSDRDNRSITGQIAFETMPGNSIFLASEYRITDFSPVSGGETETDGTNTKLGFQIDTGRAISGAIYAGYIERDNEDRGTDDTSDYYTGARLSWNVTPLTSLQLVLDKSFYDLAIADATGAIRTTRRATLRHQFTTEVSASVTGGADGTRRIGSTNGDADKSEIYYGNLTTDYRVTDYASLRATYDYRQRENDDEDDEGYTNNQISLSLVLAY